MSDNTTPEDPSHIDLGAKFNERWKKVFDNTSPVPDIKDLTSLPITPLDIYHLLEQWGTLTVWNAFDLDPPGLKKLLEVPGISEHFNIYDRGSCLIMTPKSLFSSLRTANDGLKTARALANAIYQKGWTTVEFAGLDKYMHAFWVEVQHLGDKHGRRLEILNHTPSTQIIKTYHDQAQNKQDTMTYT